jgi:hypothetical protein
MKCIYVKLPNMLLLGLKQKSFFLFRENTKFRVNSYIITKFAKFGSLLDLLLLARHSVAFLPDSNTAACLPDLLAVFPPPVACLLACHSAACLQAACLTD